jgi:hypothetical protein
MGNFTILAGLVLGAVGQGLNRKKSMPTEWVKVVMALAGLALALVAVGPPTSLWGDDFLEWFDHAWMFVLAVPGAASMLAIVPGMKTDSQP